MAGKPASPSSPSQQQKGSLRQKNFVLWIMGLTLAFQFVSHLKMWRALHEEDASSPEDEACLASAAASPRCAEAQLFRSWQRAANAAALAAASSSASRGALEVEDMTSMAPYGDASMLLHAVFATPPPPQPVAALSTSPTLPPAEAAVAVAGPAAHGAEASSAVAPKEIKASGPLTSWAQSLVDLQKSLEDQLQAMRGRRHGHQAEPTSDFEREAAKITESLEGTSSLTNWGQGVQKLQEDMEARQAALPSQRRLQEPSLMDQINAARKELCEAPERRDRQECIDFLAHLAASGEAAADAARLGRHAAAGAAGRAVAAAGSSMDELHEHTKVVEAELAKIAEERETWQRQFDAKVRDTYTEFCASRGGIWCTTTAAPPAAPADTKADDERSAWQRQFDSKVRELYTEMCEARGGAWCTTSPRPSAAERHAAHEQLRATITREAKERSAALDAKLAQLAADRRTWERELLEHYGLASSNASGEVHDEALAQNAADAAADEPGTTTLAPLFAGVPNLHWSAVAAWKEAREQRRQQKLRGAAGAAEGHRHIEVTRTELAPGRWVGALPKVAAVAAVPLSHGAKSQVKYIIETFNKPSYKGPKQLILVYHHEDEEGAEVARTYADGAYVKAVAARGPREEYPSATALRFGAWSSDADAIAQWDFDEWQHPQRLSLQVRALAFAGKPACLMRPPPSAQQRANHEEPKLWDGSILGETAWMREHWHPGITEQHAVLEGAEAANVVALSMASPTHAASRSSERAPSTPASKEKLGAIRESIDRSFEQLLKLYEVPEGAAPKDEQLPASAAAAAAAPPAATIAA